MQNKNKIILPAAFIVCALAGYFGTSYLKSHLGHSDEAVENPGEKSGIANPPQQTDVRTVNNSYNNSAATASGSTEYPSSQVVTTEVVTIDAPATPSSTPTRRPVTTNTQTAEPVTQDVAVNKVTTPTPTPSNTVKPTPAREEIVTSTTPTHTTRQGITTTQPSTNTTAQINASTTQQINTSTNQQINSGTAQHVTTNTTSQTNSGTAAIATPPQPKGMSDAEFEQLLRSRSNKLLKGGISITAENQKSGERRVRSVNDVYNKIEEGQWSGIKKVTVLRDGEGNITGARIVADYSE